MKLNKKDLVLKAIKENSSPDKRLSITQIDEILKGVVSHPTICHWVSILQIEKKINVEDRKSIKLVWI